MVQVMMIWDNDPAHNAAGHNFILNASSTSFYCSRDDTQDDKTDDDGEYSLEFGCWIECLSAFPAGDPHEWHFLELTMCLLQGPLVTTVFAAQV